MLLLSKNETTSLGTLTATQHICMISSTSAEAQNKSTEEDLPPQQQAGLLSRSDDMLSRVTHK